MPFVHPQLDVGGWTGLTIEGEQMPGVVEFPDFEVSRKIDEKPSPGSESFRLTDKGPECTDVRFLFRIWREEHFPDFAEMYRDFLDPRRKLDKRNVVTVVHPSLYLAGIRRLYFCKASGIQPSTQGGKTSYTIKAVGKEFNEKTTLGGQGTSTPKPKVNYAGQGGKWTKGALAKSQGNPEAGTSIAPGPGQPLQSLQPTQSAATQKPTVRTTDQWRRDAAAGDPDAQLVVARLDSSAGRK